MPPRTAGDTHPIVARTKPLQTNVQCRVAARQTDESGLNVCFSFLVSWLCPKSEVDSLRDPIISCHQHLSEDVLLQKS